MMKKFFLLLLICLSLEAWEDPLQIASYKATIVDLRRDHSPLYEELDDPPYSRYVREITNFYVHLDNGLVLDCCDWHMPCFPEYFTVGSQIEVHLYTKLNGYLYAELFFPNRVKHRFWGKDSYFDVAPYDHVIEIQEIQSDSIVTNTGRRLKSIGHCHGTEKLKVGDWMACYYYPREDCEYGIILYKQSGEGVGPFKME